MDLDVFGVTASLLMQCTTCRHDTVARVLYVPRVVGGEERYRKKSDGREPLR